MSYTSTICPYTPQQNGLVERKDQHIMNVTRSLCFQVNLPMRFWVDYVLHAVDFINRILSPVINT